MKSRVRLSDENLDPVDDTLPSSHVSASTSSPSPSIMSKLAYRSNHGPLPPTMGTGSFTHETAVKIKNLYRARGWNPHVSAADLQLLRVNLSCLSLDKDSETNLVQSVPLQDMKAWLAETRPWEVRSPGRGRMQRRENSEWWNANTIYCDLASYVRENAVRGGQGLIRKTNAQRRMLRVPKMMGRNKIWYNVEDIYQNADQSRPHVTGVLTEGVRLREKELTFFELFAMTNLTKMRIDDGFASAGQIIPVTIISVGDCNARVLHGYLNSQNRRVMIKKSRILNFDEPNGYLTENWQYLLCWLLARPAVRNS